MEELKRSLGLSSLSEEWCNDMLKDDFCTENFPDSWEYDNTLIGLENPFRVLLGYIRKNKHKIWNELILSDVSRLQCITNVVLESCIKGEGSPLTGLLCGACYQHLACLEGASARNVFHNILFGKVLELLKVQDDSTSFEGILAVYDGLSEILLSDLTLSDQSYWLLVKSFLASVNLNCSHKKAENSSFNRLFDVILDDPKDFKFFIKEASTYLTAGKSYVSERCSSLICHFVRNNSENKRVIAHHLNLIHTLCACISDRTETRKQVETYILKLVLVLPKDCFFEFVDWIITHLCMSQKVVHRIFGVEMCFQLSFNDFVTCAEDPSILGLLFQTITLGLCDKAPTVRAKSAMVLSDLLKNAPTASRQSLLTYFEPSSNENILHVVQFLSSDEKSSVRKASCSLLLMMLLKIKLRSSWLKIIYRFCLDTAVSVRKQALVSVAQLLAEYESDPVVQRLWLETVLPAANDNENSVKDYCNLQLENLLNKLSLSEHSWEILQLIAHPKSLDLQTYFDFGIHNLKDFTISVDSKKYLLDKMQDTQFTHSVLLVVSKMLNKFSEIGSCELMDIFERSLATRSDDSYQTMCLSLTCLRNLQSISDIEQIVVKLRAELKKFTHPYIVIKELVATIANLLHRTDKHQIIPLCKESISEIGTVLQNLCLTKSAPDLISAMKMCCYLFTLGEIAMHFTQEIDSTVVLSLKELIIGNEDTSFSTSVRAHSIIALGKICLVHEDVAKDSVMLFSKVLEDDRNFEIRNNILIVLGDLIVRYPTIIAEYLYCVTDCLQDESMIVRRQAIIVLTKLLQEDYLKWRSGIVMKFISNLVCDDSEIRQLCELCLSNILLVRYPKTYFDFFIEVVFFANGLFSFLTTTEPNLLHFSLPCQEDDTKRRKIYTAMLQNLGDQQKLDLTTRICKEILTLFVVDNDDPIDKKLIPLLHDSLWILCCPSLKLSSLKTRACHDFDDDDSNIGIIEAQTKVISNIVKRNFVENCTPIIIQLRQKLRRLKSPLQNDLTKFIVLFVTEFKSEIEVLSGDDAQFVAEVQYDMDEFKKRESNIHGPSSDSELQKTVNGTLKTPGFLRSFKTPHTGRGLNLALANQGPGMFLNSPFFAAPTPHSLSKSVAYKRPKVPANNGAIALRKNLLSDLIMKEATTTTIVVSQKVSVTKSSCQDESQSQNEKITQSNISVHSSLVHHEMEEDDQEISYTEHTTTIKIVNSPGPPKEFVDNAQDGIGIKNEIHSPSDKFTKKLGRNLFNPDASADLTNASRMSSENTVNDVARDPQEDLLLTNKAVKGFVRMNIKMESTKRALINSQKPIPSTSDQSKTNQQPKKPFQLADLIREKLREQKRRKAELAKAIGADDTAAIPEAALGKEQTKPLEVKPETHTAVDSSPEPGSGVPGTEAANEPQESESDEVMKDDITNTAGTKEPVPTIDSRTTRNRTPEVSPAEVPPEGADNKKSSTEQRMTRRSARFNRLVSQLTGAPSSKGKLSSHHHKLTGDRGENSGANGNIPSGSVAGQEDGPSTGNSENTPPTRENLSTAKEDNQSELAAKRRARVSKILKQFQPKQPEKPVDAVFEKPSAPTRASKRVNKLLAQLKPKTTPATGCIVDKPENILLGNQVLRKRKNPNDSGHCVYQEDDLIPKSKRRSTENNVHLGNVTFDPHDPHLVTSTPAVPLKVRRASERLMRRSDITFNKSDPAIVTSTPFVPGKTVPKKIVSSTPATVTVASTRLQMKCNLSPIKSDSCQKN